MLIIPAVLTGIHCSHRQKKAGRIILIGIDGMGISGFQHARMPNLDGLVREGALSLETRSVMPTVSAPNWGSHLLGAGPEQHGITQNGWTTDNHTIDPVVLDTKGYFPSIFNLIREQVPGAKTGFFYDWDALPDLFNPDMIDRSEYSEDYNQTLAKATPWIIDNRPLFTFLYFGHPDEEGHAHQWGSKEYLEAIEDVDAALGRFFHALKEAGLYEGTHFLVVSDHGGVGYGHGGLSMEEIRTPWIISGPGIISDRLIEQPNNVMNTAATIAYLLNLDVPYAWTGRPVFGAFRGEAMARSNTRRYVPQPMSSMQSGLYQQSETVAFTVSDPDVPIRYTLDGSDPDDGSAIYKSPILLQKSTIVKAAGTREGEMSIVTEVDYTRVLSIRSIRLASEPDAKYAASGASTLDDLVQGSANFNDGKWLGFSGDDLEAVLQFDAVTRVSNFSAGILNNPHAWIFPPEEIVVQASVDGDDYSEIGRLDRLGIERKLHSGRNEIKVNLTPASARFIKVLIKNTGICPAGHAGAGEPAWLFVDELILG